jgi:hypothetical protein
MKAEKLTMSLDLKARDPQIRKLLTLHLEQRMGIGHFQSNRMKILFAGKYCVELLYVYFGRNSFSYLCVNVDIDFRKYFKGDH